MNDFTNGEYNNLYYMLNQQTYIDYTKENAMQIISTTNKTSFGLLEVNRYI